MRKLLGTFLALLLLLLVAEPLRPLPLAAGDLRPPAVRGMTEAALAR